MSTLDHLLNYWEFSISAHLCKSYLLCKLIVVPFMEAIFGTFTVSMPVKPTDPGTLQLKFAGTCHSLHIHFLLRIFLKNSTLWKFAQSILHSWNPLIWQVGLISAYSLQYYFRSNIPCISDKFSLDILNSPLRAIFEECGPLTIQEEDNIECLQHLRLQLRDCEEDDIRED